MRSTKIVAVKTISIALIIIMTIVPNLGYIQTPWLKITLIHIPVILISMLFGVKMGIFMGALFGISSFISNTLNPSVLSFAFTPFYKLGDIGGGIYSLIICFIPRIFLGIFAGCISNKDMSRIKLFFTGFILTLFHTIAVLSLINIFYNHEYANVMKLASDGVLKALMIIVGVNGIPEAITAGILLTFMYKPLLKFVKNR